MLAERALEATTSIALLVTFVLGVLIGQVIYSTPIASAVVLTALLAWKAETSQICGRAHARRNSERRFSGASRLRDLSNPSGPVR